MTADAPAPSGGGAGTGGRVLGNFLYLFAAQMVAGVAGLISTALLARRLGTEAYGILGFGSAMLSYFGLLVVFGTDIWGMRAIAQDRGGAAAIVRRVLGLRTTLALAVSLLFLLAVSRLQLEERVRIVLVIQGLGLIVSAYALDFVFQAVQRMRPIALRQMLASTVAVVAVIVLIRGPDDLYIAAGIPVVATALGAAWLAVRMNREVAPFGFDFDRSGWGAILRAALPIMLGYVMSTVFWQMDIVMLGFMASRHDLGLYVAASRVLTIAIMFAGLVTSAFSPALAESWPGAVAMQARVRDFAVAALFIGAPVAAGGLAFPGAILATLFGSGYVGADAALAMLMGAAALAYLAAAAAAALVAWHDQVAHMIVFGIGAAANVALNFALIPRFGIDGAAFATLAAQGLVTVGVLARMRLRFGVLGLAPSLVFALCALVAFGGFRAVEIAAGARLLADAPVLRLLAGGAICGAVYVALAALARRDDLGRLAAAFGARFRRG